MVIICDCVTLFFPASETLTHTHGFAISFFFLLLPASLLHGRERRTGPGKMALLPKSR